MQRRTGYYFTLASALMLVVLLTSHASRAMVENGDKTAQSSKSQTANEMPSMQPSGHSHHSSHDNGGDSVPFSGLASYFTRSERFNTPVFSPPFVSSMAFAPQTIDVHVGPNGEYRFSPNPVTINAGDTIRWIWDSAGHTVNSGNPCTPDHLFDQNQTAKGITFSYTFTTAGTYPYFCTPHCDYQGMSGTVIVQGAVSSPASLQFSSATYSAAEGFATANVTVSRSGDSSSTVTVDYATSDGTASQRTDYTVATGTLTFAPGVTSQNISILITKDAYSEGPETVNLTLKNPTGGAVLGTPGTTVLTINDDATVPASLQPIDDARTFVGQHYHDFLTREPDQSGWDYWTGQITQCGADQACINNRRIGVSNAFFYELEYQQTASYAFRLYRAAYGNNQPFPNPDNSNTAEAMKMPSYEVFSPDRARVVGGTDQAASQQALALVFVQRAEFTARYPLSQDGTAFITALLNNIKNDSGADLTSQQAALLNLYNGAGSQTAGRAVVLYRIADDNAAGNPINNRAFIDAEYNRAFVFSQYAGYLRRNSDIGGFLFWLGQVNRFAIRSVPIQNAMVCSFITSVEYQQRFSSVVTHTNQECPQ